jgi:hypothetical protein
MAPGMDHPLANGKISDSATPPVQFSLRSLFIISSWASLWLGAWACMAYLSNAPTVYRGPLPAIVLFMVIYTCPYAVFGYMVGRHKLGIIVGLAFSVLFMILAVATMPRVQ